MEAQDAVDATLDGQASDLRIGNQKRARPQTDVRDPDCPQDQRTDVQDADCSQDQQIDARDQTGVVEASQRSRLVRRVRDAFRSVGNGFRLVGDVVGSAVMKWFRERRMRSLRRAPVVDSLSTV